MLATGSAEWVPGKSVAQAADRRAVRMAGADGDAAVPGWHVRRQDLRLIQLIPYVPTRHDTVRDLLSLAGWEPTTWCMTLVRVTDESSSLRCGTSARVAAASRDGSRSGGYHARARLKAWWARKASAAATPDCEPRTWHCSRITSANRAKSLPAPRASWLR